MSQVRAMVKSLNYLLFYKLQCIRTNTPFKAFALSFVNKFSILNSAPTHGHESAFDFQNPNQFPWTGKKSGGYVKDWFSTESDTEYDQNPNGGSCTETDSDYDHGSSTESDSEDDLQCYDRENFGYCFDMDENCLNSQFSSYSQFPSYSQPNAAGKEKQLLGTIEELDAFCKDRNLKQALEVLGLLEQNNVSVDIPIYLFLMNECGESQALQEAKHLHQHLTRSVPCLDIYIYNKILEMYLKCGSMEDAYKLFDEMPQRNLTSWDTMITWLAINGYGEDAIEMFAEFKKVGLKPDNQMFHGVFAACSLVGDMKEGLLHFESMRNKYSLVPSMDDYETVVDMLGSSGYLNEALEFIEKMPIKPNVEIWEIMMNQSRVHGDLQLGDHCAEIVNLLDPSLLDEHSNKGLIPIKRSDIAKEKKKPSGFNLLDIKTQIYKYMQKDTSQPDHEKLYMQLWCLKQPMIEAGYVPNTRVVLYDVDQESKEESLLLHSETLAVSQALLTSPARAPIRIYNHVRICHNCHNALKIISKLVGRPIIARDESRFHHYKNGVCSCGDYW